MARQEKRRKKPERQNWHPNFLLRIVYRFWRIALSALKIAVAAVATVVLICVICGFVFASMLGQYLQDDIIPLAQINLENYDMEKTSYVYYFDESGNPQILQKLSTTTDRRWLDYEDIPEDLIHVTADPVIRVKKPDSSLGPDILAQEGCPRVPGKLTVGWAVKSRRPDPRFYEEIQKCILWLKEEYGADSVLIPFFYDEDLSVCEAIASGLDGQAGCLRRKYLSEEMLSIIGSMDILVGVRLHSLIYAAVMGVPMLGISYDPKVGSFLASIYQPTYFDVDNFTLETFQTAFRQTYSNRDAICQTTARRLDELIARLDRNEELIRAIMG